jgi:predicted metalloprotease with PDZ domain
MLPFRMGLVSKEDTLKEIQSRTDAYYTNPTRHLENIEAAKICWQDRRAQRLPYGRGFFFLANTDVKIRQATDGQYSIDDVVLDILEKSSKGATLGNEVFLQTVKDISGVDVTADWETMRTGGHIVPIEGCFDGHFSVTETEVPEADTGKPVTSYRWAIK